MRASHSADTCEQDNLMRVCRRRATSSVVSVFCCPSARLLHTSDLFSLCPSGRAPAEVTCARATDSSIRVRTGFGSVRERARVRSLETGQAINYISEGKVRAFFSGSLPALLFCLVFFSVFMYERNYERKRRRTFESISHPKCVCFFLSPVGHKRQQLNALYKVRNAFSSPNRLGCFFQSRSCDLCFFILES